MISNLIPSFSLHDSTIDYFYFVIAFLLFLYLLEALLDRYYFEESNDFENNSEQDVVSLDQRTALAETHELKGKVT